ncbi:MAG: ATP-binding protein [Chlamydiota bacterium]
MEIEKHLLEPESKTLEFKRDLSSLDPILKTIVAFANTARGTLIIGYSQAEGLLGIEDIFKAEERIANAIADSIHPFILPEIEISSVQGKHLLVIQVAHWRSPFYLKKLGVPPGIYARLGSTSRPADVTLIAEMQRQVVYRYFDEQPLIDLSLDSLDLEKAKRLFQKEDKELDENKLEALGICVSSANRIVPSIRGLILFGKESPLKKFLPDARVCCARFTGDDKTHIIDRYEVKGTILDAVDDVLKFIGRNTRLAAEILTVRRRDIEEYPTVALINALAHCDYSIPGSHIQIAIFNDRLAIQNPGMLPLGFTLENFKSGGSRIRNRVIARVFSELKFMEEWGSGYKRILSACHADGYPEPL